MLLNVSECYLVAGALLLGRIQALACTSLYWRPVCYQHRHQDDKTTPLPLCDTEQDLWHRATLLEQNVECLKFLNLVRAAPAARARVRWLCNVIEGMLGILMGFVTAAVTYVLVQSVPVHVGPESTFQKCGQCSGLTLSLNVEIVVAASAQYHLLSGIRQVQGFSLKLVNTHPHFPRGESCCSLARFVCTSISVLKCTKNRVKFI